MKKVFLFPILFVIIMGYFSVSSYPSLGNNEIIQDTIKINYQDVVIKCSSGECKKCIITNDQEYQDLLKYRSAHPDCADYKLPSIDFSKYILIGETISAGGCKQPDIEKELIKVPSDKKYTLQIQVKQNGGCEKLFHLKVWITMPKIESDYKIEFNITHIQ